jgi:hypothetical protein
MLFDADDRVTQTVHETIETGRRLVGVRSLTGQRLAR